MPESSPSGRVYKTTPAQRAKAAAWREANPDKSLAYGRAQTIRKRDSFIGPRRPRGRQRVEGPTTAQRAEAARRGQRSRSDAMWFASYRRGKTIPADLTHPKNIRQWNRESSAPSLPPADTAIDTLLVNAAKVAGKERGILAKAAHALEDTPEGRTAKRMLDKQAAGRSKPPPVIFGPPAPLRSILREAMRQEVAQAKAQAAADRLAAKAEAKAIERAHKTWDRESVKVIRKIVRYIREQVREAEQIRARSRTPEQRAASIAAYEAAMASWDVEQRRIADETRNAFRRRVDAEQARMVSQDSPATSAMPLDPTTAALLASMRAPVRRVPYTR